MNANGNQVKQLHNHVTQVLDRLEESVKNFDNHKIIREFKIRNCTTSALSSDTIFNTIQDAIVKLDLGPSQDESNLAILPLIVDNTQIALTSHSIARYISCLDAKHGHHITAWITEETTNWLTTIFRLANYDGLYKYDFGDGFVRLLQSLLCKYYPSYEETGYYCFIGGKQPVIYVDSSRTAEIIRFFLKDIGVPHHFVYEIFQTFIENRAGEHAEEAYLSKLVENDLANNKQPIAFIFDSENVSFVCSVDIIRNACKKYGIWSHAYGHRIASLCISTTHAHRDKAQGDKAQDDKAQEGESYADSVTMDLSSWLNIPTLPFVTLYRRNVLSHPPVQPKSVYPAALPLWCALQAIGRNEIVRQITSKFDSCAQFLNNLRNVSGIKVYEDERDTYHSQVTFKFVPENYQLWTPTYCDKLNVWLIQVLQRNLTLVPVVLSRSESAGLVLRYTPFEFAPLIEECDWETFYACLNAQLGVLRSTVAQKEILHVLVERSKCLEFVELQDWAGMGGVCYVPRSMEHLRTENAKEELNRLNKQVVERLKGIDTAFSTGEGADGRVCIRFGMIGLDSDVTELINLVERVGKEVEDTWSIMDDITEVVKKGIETATLDIQKENDELIWKEGLLRHVPVFGNIVNWFSPLDKRNTGVRGRSLNLSAGLIESTENIYKYHMQTGSNNEIINTSTPQPEVRTPILARKEGSNNASGELPGVSQTKTNDNE